MKNEKIHHLIGDIYEASQNPEKWNILVRRISSILLELQSDSVYSQKYLTSSSDVLVNKKTGTDSQVVPLSSRKNSSWDESIETREITELLNIHFNRAQKISEKNQETSGDYTTLENTLNYLKVPIIIIDKNHLITFINKQAEKFVEQNDLLDIRHQNEIELKNKVLANKFKTLIIKSISENIAQTMELSARGRGEAASIVVTPISKDYENFVEFAAIFISTHDSDVEVSEIELKEIYGITKAESRLISNLVKGFSLKEISQRNHVAMSTLRSQLKSVFTKTDTSRQSELVRLILLSHNRLLNKEYQNEKKLFASNSKDTLNQTMILKDGRKLGFAEYGDLDGLPVIACHPLTGSRYQNHPNENITRSLGIRLIVPDRPGFGLSSPKKNRMFSDWGEDLKEFVELLGIDQFTILAYCGGAPYAIAGTIHLKERINKLILVSPVTPYDMIDILYGAKTHNRMLVNIASRLPSSIFQIANILARGLIKNPGKYFDDVINQLCDTDSSTLNEPEFLDNFQIALAESLVQGPKEFVNEQVLLANDWGLTFNKINCEVQFWHGEQDKHVPIDFSKQFSNDFRHVNFNVLPEYGHFLIYPYWEDILKGIRN